MIIDGEKIKEGDQIIYRGYVATYEGDLHGSFTLAHEDTYESVISFPSSLEEIIDEVDEECGTVVMSNKYEVIRF